MSPAKMSRRTMSSTSSSSCASMRRKKAILVGVTDDAEDGTQTAISLRSHQDVEKIKRVLLTHYGYREKDIIVMLDKKGIHPNLRPTKRNIVRQLNRLTRKAEPGDKFFFFYAGHGEQRKCHSDSESDGFDEFIHCEKGRTIKDNRLRRILVDPLPQGAQLVALFDTCHAGTMLDLPHNACNHVVSVGLAVVVVARLHRVVASIRVRASARARAGSSATCTANINATVEVVEGRMAGMCVDVDVPRRTRRCNGDCVASVSSRAHVVSISSTADDEESWENEEGGPLTKAFVDIVDENPHLTYRELMVRLQQRLSASYQERLAQVNDYQVRWQRYLASVSSTHVATLDAQRQEILDLVERARKVQRPQLTSLQPLDLDRPLAL